jgi:hypothetical protein
MVKFRVFFNAKAGGGYSNLCALEDQLAGGFISNLNDICVIIDSFGVLDDFCRITSKYLVRERRMKVNKQQCEGSTYCGLQALFRMVVD